MRGVLGNTLPEPHCVEDGMAMKVTAKGQTTSLKTARQSAGVRPRDCGTAPVGPEGGVALEREAAPGEEAAFRARLEAIARRRPLANGPFGDRTTDEIAPASGRRLTVVDRNLAIGVG